MFPSEAFAQASGAAPAPDPMMGMLSQLGFILPMFIIMYMLLIRPQQQQRKKAEAMIKALKKGDRVLTTGGIYGTVLGLDESKATLKIADDTKVEFAKSAIVQVLENAKS